MGGLIINSHQYNKININASKIFENKFCGVCSIGEQSQPLISQNLIYDNEGPGIFIATSNKAKVQLKFRQ